MEKVDDLLGTNYRQEIGAGLTIDQLILVVTIVLASHHVVVLVIDEIQNLYYPSGVGQAKMINTLVSCLNEVKILHIVIRAIHSGCERLTEDLISEVAQEHIAPMLKELRQGNK